uniref:SH2 domain-containing protein n=1 Tax=Poecilia latipinna TaxID=48699 RepID=A0A3B3URP0_9TELE
RRMSSVPQRSVVMGWSPQQLADYLKRMNLPGCDKVVLKNSISGSRFVNLTDNDLQKFPKLHAPMISKISNEIYKNEKKGLFSKKYVSHKQTSVNHRTKIIRVIQPDDEEFDDDYESPYSDEDDRDYESPNDDLDAGNDYEPPPSEPAEDHKLCPSQPIGDGDYIGTHMAQQSHNADPIKPTARSPGHRSSEVNGFCFCVQTGGTTTWRPEARPPLSDASEPPRSKPPVLPPPSSSVSRKTPSALKPNLDQLGVQKNHNFLFRPWLGSRGCCCITLCRAEDIQQLQHCVCVCIGLQALDPNWYVGKVSRGQAEGCLKKVQRDGAYLVRDSTRQQPNQPFTLMVFYQDKVYNIQIRQHSQQFQLGTGLKAQEFFPSVSDIINHYSQSPLVLIDAKNRSSSHQNQCLLSDPAGYYLEQSWS